MLTPLSPLWPRLQSYLLACHLHRPVDLLLLLLPVLWTLSFATAPYRYSDVTALLLAAVLARCAAWLYHDLLDAPLRQETAPTPCLARREARLLLGALFTLCILSLLAIGVDALFWGLPALTLLLGYPHIKRRTLLTEPYLALCLAWVVVVAQLASPGISGKVLWLLFTATLLWSTATTLLYSLSRRNTGEQEGVGSLLYLFGENTGKITLALQIFAILTLWLTGRQATLGLPFGLGLLTALALAGHQQWLLAHHPVGGAALAYRHNILFGLAILIGLSAERF